MKYAIVKVINSNYSIHAEGITSIQSALVSFHGLCQTLWNAEDVISACVMIIDENMDCVGGYKEHITHEVINEEPEEPEPEEPEELEEPENPLDI